MAIRLNDDKEAQAWEHEAFRPNCHDAGHAGGWELRPACACQLLGSVAEGYLAADALVYCCRLAYWWSEARRLLGSKPKRGRLWLAHYWLLDYWGRRKLRVDARTR